MNGSKQAPAVGAVVIGGDHTGLGVARSLGRAGIPVVVLDDQFSLSSFSRYVKRVVRVKDLRSERGTVDAILDAGKRFDLKNWVLFPTRDETVVAVARYRDELAAFFKVTTADWASVQWAWNKKNTYDLAENSASLALRRSIRAVLRSWSLFTPGCHSPSSPR